MVAKTYVTLEGRQYSVTKYADGSVSIWTSWETINPRTVWSVRPEVWHRSASVSPYGRLGKKVLKLAAASLKEGS